MARRSLEDRIAELGQLRAEPTGDGAAQVLSAALAAKESVLVAAAAQIVAQAQLPGHTAALAAAFDRFMVRPASTDKGCLAKRALIEALYRTEADASACFLRGIRHVQMEPVWGGKEDTAIDLRVSSALGLVRCGYVDVIAELARLLADGEIMARVGAARALAYTANADGAAPLLQYVALCRGEDTRVVGACVEGVLALERRHGLALAQELLERDDTDIVATTCVALGESRLDEALPLLIRAADGRATSEAREPMMIAIAMLRSETAWQHLLSQVRDGDAGRARDALAALSAFRADRALVERVRLAATERGDPRLSALTDELLSR